jgi:RecA-family ATPase
MIPRRGASLIVGASKSGKTLLAAQAAIAVASGTALFQNYRVLQQGAVMMIEQDDPDASASVKQILERSSVPVADIPFHLVPKVPYTFGPELIDWLEGEIASRLLRLVVLDSYTALRGPRPKGIDIVKAEHEDLTQLDALAMRTDSALVILHHNSKGSAALDWSQQAAGTFAMSMATEAQIVVARFPDLDIAAPERLVRILGRHMEDLEMVLRFRKEGLDYQHVIEGGASSAYPLILQIHTTFGSQAFGPKQLTHETGVSRATASRQVDKLFRAGALTKRGYGEYVLDGVKL